MSLTKSPNCEKEISIYKYRLQLGKIEQKMKWVGIAIILLLFVTFSLWNIIRKQNTVTYIISHYYTYENINGAFVKNSYPVFPNLGKGIITIANDTIKVVTDKYNQVFCIDSTEGEKEIHYYCSYLGSDNTAHIIKNKKTLTIELCEEKTEYSVIKKR